MEGCAVTSGADDRVLAALAAPGVPYERVDIDPAFADTAAFCAKYGFALDASANTIIVASKRGEKVYSASVVLATTRLDVNRMVKRLMGVSKFSFASAEETLELTGMEIGGEAPFGPPPHPPTPRARRGMSLDEITPGLGLWAG